MAYLGVKRIFVFEERKIFEHNPAEERGTGGHEGTRRKNKGKRERRD
jgi:hypothetical protein